ncbi:MAG: CopD family protein [Thermomicrobiales bacterium]
MGRTLSRAGGLIVLLFLLLASCGVRPAPVAAHAFLESSDPVANAVVPIAPGTVTLRFTEPLEPSYSRAQLFDQTGAEVAGASSGVTSDPTVMTVTLPSGLGNGTYSILWRSLSAVDGHTAQGYVPFTIGTQADVQIVAPPVAQTDTSELPGWVLSVARWLALLGLAAVAAIWPVWIFVVRPAIAPAWQLGPRLTRRARGYAVAVVVFAMIANVVALVGQAASIAGPANLVSGLTTTLSDTRYGTWWLVRSGALMIFAAVLLGAPWWRPWRQRWVTWLALVVAAVLPLPFSMISHAGGEPAGQATAIAFDYAHLVGATLWIGGLFFLLATLVPIQRHLTASGRRVILGRALPRFSLLALIAWGVLAVTGVYSALLQVGGLSALTGTPYGQTLILKLVLIVPLLALAAFNLLVVTRKLRAAETEQQVEGWGGHFVTALMAEAVIVTMLLGVVGMLIGTPPARQVLALDAGRITIPLDAAGQTGTLSITPGAVGQNHYRLELGSGHEAHLRNPAITDATLRLELPDRQTGQLDVPLLPSPAGGYEAHGSEIAFPGEWHFQVTVRLPGQPDWVATATREVTAEAPRGPDLIPPPLFGPSGVAAVFLLVAGIAGLGFGLISGSRPMRKEAVGLGAAAMIIGVVLLAQARLPQQAVASLDSPNDALLAPLDPVAVARGQELFSQNCVTCHGPAGKGDGPEAAKLERPPANLTAGHAFAHSDTDIAYWIANGIEGTGMPGFSGTLSQGQIQDVVTYVRSLQQAALAVRDAPGAEACQIAPRSLVEIAQLAATPAASEEPPNATETGGTPADAAIQAEIKTTARELVACTNAGDILRRLALYSDARMRYAYPDGPNEALKAMAATPLPLPPLERVALVSVDDVRVLPDGRVMARVTVDNPAIHSHVPGAQVSQEETARLIFAKEGGQWRVDETRREDAQNNATPVAGSGGA